MTVYDADVVVLDIEGTTGSLSHVRDVLFPYARREFTGWLTNHRDEPRVRELMDAVGREVGRPGIGPDGVAAALAAWSDADVKAAPLKTVQGWIWAEGYAAGRLHGHVYPEVPGVLRDWRAAGTGIAVYSSGSAAAQRDWFRHTGYGDLSGLLDAFFDLDSAGAKTDPASYRAIARAVGAPSGRLLFLSDVAAELDAALAAGWQAAGVRRDGDPRGPEVPGHRTVPSLDRLRVCRPSSSAPSRGLPGTSSS
ncbi:acireductone synthase [Streptomyces sp. TG1A-8]|uniref:acireductone synthase n=1 Tax=Streptomyces sp. TG1A-8 TaxID=3051385 RepID=UPI00265BED81|nr:acireductone synthase [Streptomyces sp. TG1A-8]MDO0924216.1 acireductone synthase [Streptomyces sp. TG1A-8]